jgi:hypothetical protein
MFTFNVLYNIKMSDIKYEKFEEHDLPTTSNYADLNRFVFAHLPLAEADKAKFLRQCLIEQRRDEHRRKEDSEKNKPAHHIIKSLDSGKRCTESIYSVKHRDGKGCRAVDGKKPNNNKLPSVNMNEDGLNNMTDPTSLSSTPTRSMTRAAQGTKGRAEDTGPEITLDQMCS